MRITRAILFLVMTGISFASSAKTVILDCAWSGTPIEQYDRATSIVVATVLSVSIKDTGQQLPRRTILWDVKQSWKGPHYKGAKFTTREQTYAAASSWSLTPGRSMLLYLDGREPYKLYGPWCGSSGYLEDSIPQLEDLFKFRKDWGNDA